MKHPCGSINSDLLNCWFDPLQTVWLYRIAIDSDGCYGISDRELCNAEDEPYCLIIIVPDQDVSFFSILGSSDLYHHLLTEEIERVLVSSGYNIRHSYYQETKYRQLFYVNQNNDEQIFEQLKANGFVFRECYINVKGEYPRDYIGTIIKSGLKINLFCGPGINPSDKSRRKYLAYTIPNINILNKHNAESVSTEMDNYFISRNWIRAKW